MTAFIAVKDARFIGFCCYDATVRGMVGPLGVDEAHRSGGTGSAVYMACLLDMKLAGYGYGTLGMIAEDMMGYYHHLSGAVAIPGSGKSVWDTWANATD